MQDVMEAAPKDVVVERHVFICKGGKKQTKYSLKLRILITMMKSINVFFHIGFGSFCWTSETNMKKCSENASYIWTLSSDSEPGSRV